MNVALKHADNFLPEDGVYHQADTAYWDKPGNDINTFNQLLEGALSEKCYAELVSFICNTFYRPCSEVEDANGNSTWIPSLLCRSECETLNTV